MSKKNVSLYKKQVLKFYLKNGIKKSHLKELEIIVDCLKKEDKNLKKDKTYTKEELYLIGFTAFNIHRYFVPINSNQWKQKSLIIINEKVIENFNDLCKYLNLNNYKLAC